MDGFLAICLWLQVGLALSACPHIIKRSEWNARPPKAVEYLTNQPVKYAFIHHSAGQECNDQASCAAVVRSIQNFHMDIRGWNDAGYNFLIGGDGSVFEARGWDKVGAHTRGYNDVGNAFCLMGDFTDHLPPKIQMDTAKAMVECGVSLGKISPSYILMGHRDVGATACPGNTLYPEIQTWPHYSSTP